MSHTCTYVLVVYREIEELLVLLEDKVNSDLRELKDPLERQEHRAHLDHRYVLCMYIHVHIYMCIYNVCMY